MEEIDKIRDQMREFTYLVSHDLNAPLRSIGSFSKIMMAEYHDKFDATGQLYLSLIANEAERAQAMLQALLEYSRLNTLAKTTTTRFESARVLEHCKVILADEIKKNDAVITAKDLPPIQADSEQFMQLMLYLLENALKFVAPGTQPRITIRGTDKGDHWQFGVEDNGIGIEEPYREKVFALFRQLHPQGAYPGIGAGLSLARKIVERHGGTIQIDHAPQTTGTTLYFTLAKPVAAAA